MKYITDLDQPLLRLSEHDYFTLRDVVQSVAVYGAVGSGKTSGSGKALASGILRGGMSGIVCVAKTDEVELWQRYARENGRAKDLVLFGDGGGDRFNFIDYEMKAQGPLGVSSVTECIMKLLEAERVVMPNAGGSTEPFWERTPRQILNNLLPFLYAAHGTITLDDIYQFLTSAPTRADVDSQAWQERSYMYQTLRKADADPVHPLDSAHAQKMLRYWFLEFATLDDKTRGNIRITLTSAIDRFLSGRLHRLFCTDTTLTPDDIMRDGKIVVMAMPSLSWNEEGLIGQHVFKYMYQRALLRRGTLPEACRKRPQFIWADEAQFFVSLSTDKDFLTTARSNLAFSVYLSQNLPGYVAALGGSQMKAQADQLMGVFGSKVWHSNGDPETNDWAARTIGRELTVRANFGESQGSSRSRGKSKSSGESAGTSGGSSSASNGGGSTSRGTSRNTSDSLSSSSGFSDSRTRSEGGSETMDFAVEPRVFAHELRNGGIHNGRLVDAVWFQNGRRFKATGTAYLRVTFRQ